MSRASGLFRLQAVDVEMDQQRQRRAEITAVLQDDSALQQAREAVGAAEADLLNVRSETSRAEHAVMSQLAKIEKNQQALYGGGVQNPKELQDLQAELDSLTRHLETLEDRQLEAMLVQEEQEERLQTARSLLSRREQERAVQHGSLLEEKQGIDARLQSLKAERELAAANVSPEDMQRYQKLRSRLGGIAVASLQDGGCNTCGMTIPASIQQHIRGGSEIVTCPQCGRVLYAG